MLWNQTKQLPKDAFSLVEQKYIELGFSLEVRLQLPVFVESNFMPNAEVDEATAINLATQLLSQLEAKIAAIPNEPDKYMSKSKLQEIYDQLKKAYSDKLVDLYVAVRQCLEQEKEIVSQYSASSSLAGTGSGFASAEGEVASQIRQQIENLKGRVSETGMELDRCKQEQEGFSVEYYTFRESQTKVESMQQQLGEQNPEVQRLKKQQASMNNAIRSKYLSLTNKRQELTAAFKNMYDLYKLVQHEVLEKRLIQWKREQQLSGNGYPCNVGQLEILQEWCEGLADIIWTMRQQVKQLQGLREKVGDPSGSPNEQDLLTKITELLTNLVTGTFVIEKQPPQVMKTNTRFTATVRLLVGGILNVHMDGPSVAVSIVSEGQANQLLISQSQTKRKEEYNSGDILNGTGTMEYQNATKQVSVTFRNLQLKKIKRTEKKGNESVMDEKFSVIFWTDFTVGELKFQLWTLSLPVVVIVHGNQEPQALATVTWDNAFAEWGRRPFVVPDKVSWGQVAQALNMKWTHACGEGLTEENLYYLACKAFRNNNLPQNMDEINNLVLSWPLFSKEALPDRNFTFWEWFHRILLLTQQHLSKLWQARYVMGFVTKQAAEQMLLSKPSGTFLLRFSDSELGGVTIAYVRQPDMYPGQNPNVFMVAPFTTRDLNQRCMSDVIFDLNELKALYPDIPKESFRQFINIQEPTTSNGYVNHKLVTTVDGVAGQQQFINVASPAPNSIYGTSEGGPYTPATPGQPVYAQEPGQQFPELTEVEQQMELGFDINQLIEFEDIMNAQQQNQPSNF